jgi:DNA-binding response OmpR family regulator
MAEWVSVGTLSVRDDATEARLDGEALVLTHAQRLILRELLATDGRTTRRGELYDRAFGRPLASGSRAVDTHVTRIRRVLGPHGDCIVTVGRVGYRLDTEALRSRNAAAT